MSELLHTGRVLIVEGKYDAARLAGLTDAMILLTDGFGIYSDKKRQRLFKALAEKNGLILLTDSDAAGFQIRHYITNLVGEHNVVQAYVPAVRGKERRKAQPGREGLLGVEGVDDATILQCLRDALGPEAAAGGLAAEETKATASGLDAMDAKAAASDADAEGEAAVAGGLNAADAARPARGITYTDLYEWGLSGTAGSAARKAKLLHALGLPPRLSKKELVQALNRLYTYEQLDALRREVLWQEEE